MVPGLNEPIAYHALSNNLTGSDEVLPYEALHAVERGTCQTIYVECEHRDMGRLCRANCLTSCSVRQRGSDACDVLGNADLQLVHLSGVITVGVVDVQVHAGKGRRRLCPGHRWDEERRGLVSVNLE